jgi:hypothetical protein
MSDHDLIRRGDALRIVDEDDTAAFAYEQIRALPAVSPGVMPEVAALEAARAERAKAVDRAIATLAEIKGT